MLLQLSPLGIVGGFLLIAVLSTLLANTAADSPTSAIALVVDFIMVYLAYGLNRRGTAMITAVHYALTILAAYGINSLLAIYQTAPG